MFITLFRAIILYVCIIAAVRIMGKRQIGELQPSELVITILISEIAAIPMQDNGLPLINSIVPVLVLVSFEIISSVLTLKSQKFRRMMEGNSLIVIREGKIDQPQLKRLRYTTDDLMEALRQKDVFEISDVQYAIVETNGSLSVLLKPEKRTVTTDMMKVTPPDTGLSCTIISDGRVIESAFADCNMNRGKLEKAVKASHVDIKDIMLMTADKAGNTTIIKRDDAI